MSPPQTDQPTDQPTNPSNQPNQPSTPTRRVGARRRADAQRAARAAGVRGAHAATVPARGWDVSVPRQLGRFASCETVEERGAVSLGGRRTKYACWARSSRGMTERKLSTEFVVG